MKFGWKRQKSGETLRELAVRLGRIDRAFNPLPLAGSVSRGVAPGWYRERLQRSMGSLFRLTHLRAKDRSSEEFRGKSLVKEFRGNARNIALDQAGISPSFVGTKMTLGRGSFGLAPASILFHRYLSWSFQVCRYDSRLAFGAYHATASGAAGRTAGGTTCGTAGRTARGTGAAVATAVASAVVTVIAAAAVLAILIALAMRFRDEIMEPAGERPASSLAAATVPVGLACKSRSSH